MALKDYDFSGYVTRNDILCADGRTIRRNAFAAQDGMKVPLVYEHNHDAVEAIIGHGILHNRPDGVYGEFKFNNTPSGQHAKEVVRSGDVDSLSIFANKLKQTSHGDVLHGIIREVSLVLAGANPGAFIDTVMAHGSDSEMDGVIVGYDAGITINYDDETVEHSEPEETPEATESNEQLNNETLQHSDEQPAKDETVEDIIATMNDKQKAVLFGLVGMAREEADNNEEKEGEETMKHNAFENVVAKRSNTLSHSDFKAILDQGRRFGSLREGYNNWKQENILAHADDDEGGDADPTPTPQTYGIQDVEYLFPEPKNLNMPPEFISRNMDWVAKVMTGVHHIPFSRVKVMFADITEDEARAKGYIKGHLKKDEVFSLLKRKVEPTTVYKKQKMDKDDITDITDFDVLQWLKVEMRMMLNEELARAFLIGDGRLTSDEDHIDATRIIPIVNDADLFVLRWSVKPGSNDDGVARAKNFIKAAIKSRKNYRGSGNVTLYTTEDMLTDMLLLEDQIGHKLYKTEAELATAIRVKEIVTVPVMENFTDKDSKPVLGIFVNLNDYNVGADKGGGIEFFDDFDLDYNQQKFLMETRCSGALVKPFSAIVLRQGAASQTNGIQSDEPTMQDAMAPFKTSADSGNGEG